MDYTAAGLVAEVRRRASIPSTSVTGSADSDILAHINGRLQLSIAAKIIACREGFFRQTYDYALSGTTVRFQIPARALGNRLAAVLLLDGQGKVLRKLNEIPYSRLQENLSLNDCVGYMLEADEVVLVPTYPASTATTLRMVYYIRPNAVTTSIDAAGGTTFTGTVSGLTLTTTTSGYTSGMTTGTRIDIIRGHAPFAHVLIGILPTAVSATAVTLTAAQIALCATGDFVCLSEFAPVAQVPDTFYPLLAHSGALSYLEAAGDRENHKRLMEQTAKLEAEAVGLISPRVEEGAKKMVSNFGPLGAIGWGRNRYRGT